MFQVSNSTLTPHHIPWATDRTADTRRLGCIKQYYENMPGCISYLINKSHEKGNIDNYTAYK